MTDSSRGLPGEVIGKGSPCHGPDYHHLHQYTGSVTRIISWLPEMKHAQTDSVGKEDGF